MTRVPVVADKKPKASRATRVFLDIPYKKQYKPYEDAIRATLLAYGLQPVVAKDSKKTDFILQDLLNLISHSKYAIVDISGLNFNVGFEAGLLYAFPLRFMLLKNQKTKSPTDLQGIKYSEYTNTDELVMHLIEWILQNVRKAKSIPETDDLCALINKLQKSVGVTKKQSIDILIAMAIALANSDGILPHFPSVLTHP